jgi:hypothetical protein
MAVFNTVDTEDIPEVEAEQIREGILEYMTTDGVLNTVYIIKS